MIYQIRTQPLEAAIQALEIAESNALTNCEEYANQHGKAGYSVTNQALLDTAYRKVHQSLRTMREALERTAMARKAT